MKKAILLLMLGATAASTSACSTLRGAAIGGAGGAVVGTIVDN
jgi:predicted small secreted protein